MPSKGLYRTKAAPALSGDGNRRAPVEPKHGVCHYQQPFLHMAV